MKKQTYLSLFLTLSFLMTLGLGVLLAGSGTVSVNLLSSTNAGLSGGNVYYYQGGWQLLGTTDGTGTVSGIVPITTDIEIRYVGGSKKWTSVDPATNPTLTINTVLVTVKLETCGGTALAGTAQYYFQGWSPIGNSPATIELLPYSNLGPGQGSYDFRMYYDGRYSPIHRQDISANPVIAFTTTKVSMAGPNVYWYNNGWKPFVSPKEVMGGHSTKPGDNSISWADFKFNYPSSPTVTVNIDGCDLNGGVITLVDENGNPLANYPADYPSETRNLKYKYRCGGSWAPWTSFQTDANGQVFFNISCPNNNWDNKITMVLNQTTKEQNVTVNSVFQAAKVNVHLEACNPTKPLSGGVVAQGGGYWYTHGTTDASGVLSLYTFPAGSIKIRMSYNHNNETKYPAIAAGVNDVYFNTTRLTLNYSGDIKSNKGGSWWYFSKPTMDLLAGDYNFWFKTGSTWFGPVVVSVSGCDMNKILLRVLDENGNGVAGGKATPAYGGSWGTTLTGATDANGVLFADILPGFTKIRMAVNQGSQEQTVAQLNASNYTWYTEILRIWLKDHTGAAITDGTGVLDQGGGSWYNWGNFNTSGYRDIQLFPASYKFKATYNYTSQELYPVVTSGAGIQDFDFQTGQVWGSCITQYSTGAWRTFTDGMELMPGTYTFKSPSQSGTITAGGVTTLSCPTSAGYAGNPNQPEAEFVAYPNPFDRNTTIQYTLWKDDDITISVYDANGRLVNQLFKGFQKEGVHQVDWNGNYSDGNAVGPGVFYFQILLSEGMITESLIKE